MMALYVMLCAALYVTLTAQPVLAQNNPATAAPAPMPSRGTPQPAPPAPAPGSADPRLVVPGGSAGDPRAQLPAGASFPGAPQPGGPDPLQGQDIRDITGIISIPAGWWWAIYTLAALILIALVYEGWRLAGWIRHRKTPPHEAALAALEKARRELMRPDTVKEYSVAVSEAVRTYIEARFSLLGLKAQRLTTQEFLLKVLSLRNSPVAMHASGLDHFLQQCDMVKFARHTLTVQEMELLYDSAKQFVLDTREVSGEPEKPKPAPAAAPAQPVAIEADAALPRFGSVPHNTAGTAGRNGTGGGMAPHRHVPAPRPDEAYMPKPGASATGAPLYTAPAPQPPPPAPLRRQA
ncbi:hypothetical protein DB346_13965 [Verrucomicrobia bacterium LW23]|nr:hypothetical protein DB346_13965 [Verrucomicrobia bacterium LW23]